MLTALLAAVPVVFAEVADARGRLAEAIQLYLAGDSAGARAGLTDLLAAGPTLPPDVRQEALAYLGDLYYTQEDASKARPIFESLLAEAPDFPMDPFKHPPEVCGYFEDLREARRAALRPPVLPPPPVKVPYPWLALAPGGVHWFADGKPLVGTIVLVTQAGTAAASIVTYGEVQAQRKRHDPDFYGDEEARTEFAQLLWLNRAAGAAFWVAWATPAIVETTSWGRAQKVSLQVGPTSVAVTGSF
ncbi:MAG: tetratricopeptide repeat protein [Myxococcota bacterium]